MKNDAKNGDIEIKTHWSKFLLAIVMFGGLALGLLYGYMVGDKSALPGAVLFGVLTVVMCVILNKKITLTEDKLIYEHWPLKRKEVLLGEIQRIKIEQKMRGGIVTPVGGPMVVNIFGKYSEDVLLTFGINSFEDKDLGSFLKKLNEKVSTIELDDDAKEMANGHVRKVREAHAYNLIKFNTRVLEIVAIILIISGLVYGIIKKFL